MQTIKQSILSIVIGLALVAGLSYADWGGAQGDPPAFNADAPINVSDKPQKKEGALQVNGFKNTGDSIFVSSAEFRDFIKIKDGTQGNGKVLTSDADGKASWMTGGNVGEGTANYISRWTTSTKLGNSQVFDNGTNVGIGTSNPQAKLDLVGNIKIKDGTQGNGKVLTSDANGVASWSDDGYEVITVSGYGSAIVASCSASKKILGGGCKPPGGGFISFDGSYPIISGNNGWKCEFPSATFPATAYAICSN